MENNVLEAELKVSQLNQQTKLFDEFEKLKPKPYSAALGIIFASVLGWLADTYLSQSFVTYPLLALILYLAVKGESKTIHRRIDILFKLVEKRDKNA